ncbi:MAG: hypothetical protein A2390_00255 [Candidatus Liptonbacteria bacterium RIFOXYB1_FULL_36_10]|uniref:Uncharacterized protein n=2 Tax=Candidatus Liptoniibacteriota TaxID=1817909 RepID=A0A1G2CME3_9BACT|nr:MAG: hypothetical protein A2390_00255 [Candidatus Liptonbacteria bacterium RIFOXYB1_FULL_36_10]OGZ03612.1 MAG: hypothetical protein A2604_02015 [Candidatus Liptonbacteria bacterium RIFOXYD1_FULL_36_11]
MRLLFRDYNQIPSLLQIPKFSCKILKASPLILYINIVAFNNFSLEFWNSRYESVFGDSPLLKKFAGFILT